MLQNVWPRELGQRDLVCRQKVIRKKDLGCGWISQMYMGCLLRFLWNNLCLCKIEYNPEKAQFHIFDSPIKQFYEIV